MKGVHTPQLRKYTYHPHISDGICKSSEYLQMKTISCIYVTLWWRVAKQLLTHSPGPNWTCFRRQLRHKAKQAYKFEIF